LNGRKTWEYIASGILEVRIDWNINSNYRISLWASRDIRYLDISIILACYDKTVSIHFWEKYVKEK